MKKIGFISPFWLPLHGGGEQYEHRLACKLKDHGYEVFVFTGTAEKENHDNGEMDVFRHHPNGEFKYASQDVLKDLDNAAVVNFYNHFDFFEKACNWVKSNELEVVLIGNALHNSMALHARELFMALKATGVSVGLIHHDLGSRITKVIVDQYCKLNFSWEEVAEKVTTGILNYAGNISELMLYSVIESPLFFRPDFVICNSNWSASFIDPLQTTPKIIFHPLLMGKTKQFESKSDLDRSHVLMINPQDRKNPKAMIELIKSRPNLKYRVLKGGWGDSFQTFVPQILSLPAFESDNVHLVDYASDMSEIYSNTDLVFFPSLIEGYGMSAVEPMQLGTAVVSSNYPAIVEATGEGAFSICPYKSTSEDWANAVDEVLTHLEHWKSRAKKRTIELQQRQESEFIQLVSFLDSLA